MLPQSAWGWRSGQTGVLAPFKHGVLDVESSSGRVAAHQPKQGRRRTRCATNKTTG
jgi:hypothetical protein